MPLTIAVEKLIAWNDDTAQKFHDFVHINPVVFSLPSDIRSEGTVAGTLQHIVYLELRFANLIAGFPKKPLEEIPKDSIDAIHETHRHATTIMRQLLSDPTFDWSQQMVFEVPNLGPINATRESFLIHLLMHSIRHYAQLAAVIRQAGYPPTWRMDYLFSEAQAM